MERTIRRLENSRLPWGKYRRPLRWHEKSSPASRRMFDEEIALLQRQLGEEVAPGATAGSLMARPVREEL